MSVGTGKECFFLLTVKRLFGHRKEIRVLTFRVSALRQSESCQFGKVELITINTITKQAPVVQRPDNFIRWIRHYSGSKIYFTLNVVQGFRTLLN